MRKGNNVKDKPQWRVLGVVLLVAAGGGWLFALFVTFSGPERGSPGWVVDRTLAAVCGLADAKKELARYYYRAKEYRKAIKAYEGAVEILEGRLKTLDEKRALQVRQVLWLTYYNTACSACKAGLLDAAFDYLEKAIKTNPTPQSARELENNIQHDGDLRKLRGDPRYMDLLKKLRALYRAKRVET